MPKPHLIILHNETVRALLKQAWEDSEPGGANAHEEGGFVLRDAAAEFSVYRWPTGAQNEIRVPSHSGCKIGDTEIVASFHTHPNVGDDYLQEPSETDKRAVRNDPNLKGANYVGEFVISRDTIYLVTPQGQVRELVDTDDLFSDE
ncbi:MAG: DUF4329 domain-containing protein [Acidobacteriota bacterium]|nr:DUF4329 domain-containing protein [Acidobacteriota bacterium]